MMNYLASLYLLACTGIRDFAEEERGDGFTTLIITVLIVIVVGSIIIGVLRIFIPDIMTTITTRINTLFNP